MPENVNSLGLLQELCRELDHTQSLLTRAKQDFLAADHAYDSRGRTLERAVNDSMAEYLKEENERAKAIREAAERVQEYNRDFLRTRANLIQNAAILLMGFEFGGFEYGYSDDHAGQHGRTADWAST